MASLIQRRMALDRQRWSGTLSMVLGALFVLIGVADLVTGGGSRWLGIAALLFGVVSAVCGVAARRKATVARHVFEAENGQDAGKQ
jgi:drug/metabolite transporter (DMT)-like permease